MAYLALFLWQPWRELSRVQRKAVWKEFIHPLTISLTIMGIKILLMAIGVAFAFWWVSDQHYILQFSALMFAMSVVSDSPDLMIVWFYRQKIKQFIQEHEAEIQTATA